jgi:predicted Zn-dependent peptidase
MTRSRIAAAAATLLAAGLCHVCQPARANAPRVVRSTLRNKIRVVVIEIEKSENVSIFTFLPLGLAADGPGQGQWAHLVEHLAIRSTVPQGTSQTNAETLPDHMRLDFYGNTENWQEGLSHHARWLKGVPFTAENLRQEKLQANAECDFTAKRLATHKFAMAVWAQGFRHGQAHAALKGDVSRAGLAEIQQYRDQHLAVLDRTLVCIVGGLSAEVVQPVVAKHLGEITTRARIPAVVKVHEGSREMTWDLDARHLVLTWPIPHPTDKSFAPLMVAERLLMVRAFSDAELKALTGMVLVGTDLAVPEGDFFYVSASLQPDASFDAVRGRINAHVEALRSGEVGGPQVAMMAQQLALMLTAPADPAAAKALAPPNVSAAMLEGNLGLQWGMLEFRYGDRRSALAAALRSVDAKAVQHAATVYLASERQSGCAISPR